MWQFSMNTALVPDSLVAQSGVYWISLMKGDTQSANVDPVVLEGQSEK